MEVRQWFDMRRVHKVRKADPSEGWSIDQVDETDKIGAIDRDGTGSYRAHSPGPLPRTDHNAGPPQAEMHFPGKALWKRPMFPSRFPLFRERPIPVQSGPITKKFRIDSIDHSTLSGLSGGSTEGGHRTSTVQYSKEGVHGGSSRAHETIEEESDEDEDTSLISPGARSENHVFLISNRGGFTVGSRTSTAQSASHQVHIQPPTPTASSHHSPPIEKEYFVRPIAVRGQHFRFLHYSSIFRYF